MAVTGCKPGENVLLFTTYSVEWDTRLVQTCDVVLLSVVRLVSHVVIATCRLNNNTCHLQSRVCLFVWLNQ